MSAIVEFEINGQKALQVAVDDTTAHVVTADALAAWAELLGIESPVEVVELMLDAVENPVAYEATEGSGNEWTALYGAYEARVLAEEQGRPLRDANTELQARRQELKARMVGDATRSRRKKPTAAEGRGLDREKLASVVDGFDVSRHRAGFRKGFEGA